MDPSIGARIRKARVRLGLTQSDLGNLVGRNQNTISSYEKGLRSIPIEKLTDLARALQVPVAYFFDEIVEQEQDLSERLGQLGPIFRKAALRYMDYLLKSQARLSKQFPFITETMPATE